MAYDLEGKLVVAVSSRALFDLEEENTIFDEKGLEAYYAYQMERENELLRPGTGFRLVKNILKINDYFDGQKAVEVIIVSRNNSATSLRITKSIEHYLLDIERSAWTSGAAIAKYLNAFKTDLFLSANESDVQDAINSGIAAARIMPCPSAFTDDDDKLRYSGG